jgi:hypothetical protein
LLASRRPRIAAADPATGPSPRADDSLSDPSTLTRALPAPTTLATLDAETLAPAELAAALRFAEAAKAANTRRAYAADWADFRRWAASRGAGPLPCPPGLVCAYLAALADAGRSASTITRRAAAIAHHHRAAGLDPPTAIPRGARSPARHPPHPRQRAGGKTPATADLIARMLDACPRNADRPAGPARCWWQPPT